jgi:hypothetical protein
MGWLRAAASILSQSELSGDARTAVRDSGVTGTKTAPFGIAVKSATTAKRFSPTLTMTGFDSTRPSSRTIQAQSTSCARPFDGHASAILITPTAISNEPSSPASKLRASSISTRRAYAQLLNKKKALSSNGSKPKTSRPPGELQYRPAPLATRCPLGQGDLFGLTS